MAPFQENSRVRPRYAFDLLVLLALTGAGLAVWLYEPANDWAVTKLGYGWAPISAWVAALTLTLRFRPGLLIRFWRWWGIAAGAVAASLGLLSLFHPQLGLLAQASYGGSWGTVLGGAPLTLAIAKIAAIVVITPLVFFPRSVIVYYARALSVGWRGLTITWAGLCAGTSWTFSAVRRIKPSSMFRHWLGARQLAEEAPSAVPLAERATPVDSTHEEEFLSDEDEDRIPALDYDEDQIRVPDFDAGTAAPVRDPSGLKPAGKAGLSWMLPSIELLSPAESRDKDASALQDMARLVESTLGEHGVNVAVNDIKPGPRIVRFGLVPGWVPKRGSSRNNGAEAAEGPESGDGGRVKVQSILALEKDLALALKTPYLRLEAPVPGEALVGIEVPNPSPTRVMLREVMESAPFKKVAASGGLPIAMGQDTGGAPVVMDLASLPHLMIAGSTGSGKSVCINSIVASLLLTHPPDQLRMMMVDPKRVELTPFNRIPHLVTPVIVDVNDVNDALLALVREMMRRYQKMEEMGVRNISGYRAKTDDPMPYLVLFVDELADLIMSGGLEVEPNLIRLAQLGRASGIHLVLATQRPSVKVMTGLLKANIVPRVAFAVASNTDSRVILDTVGAEKLLGKGDMLLLNNDSPKPRRVQGTLVYDEEIDRFVEFWANQKGPPLPEFSMQIDDEDEEDENGYGEDTMLDQAREYAMRNPHMSASYLERRLRVGRSRADQLLEALADEGLVIPA